MKSILKRGRNDYKSVKYNQLNDLNDSDDNKGSDNEIQGLKNCFELKNRQIVGHRKTVSDLKESLVEYINYEIKPDESLQAIALRYGCSVSTIKRVNHLMSDHEFYGLRVIKLPVKKFGILSDVLVHQINSQTNWDHNIPDQRQANCPDLELLNQRQTQRSDSLTVNIGISQHLSQTNGENGFKFLSHLDEDLKKIRKSTETVIKSSSFKSLNQISALNGCDISGEQTPQQKRSAFFGCDESDYGINWFNLLLLAFVLCFLFPIIYVIYISESHSSSNNASNLLIQRHR